MVTGFHRPGLKALLGAAALAVSFFGASTVLAEDALVVEEPDLEGLTIGMSEAAVDDALSRAGWFVLAGFGSDAWVKGGVRLVTEFGADGLEAASQQGPLAGGRLAAIERCGDLLGRADIQVMNGVVACTKGEAMAVSGDAIVLEFKAAEGLSGWSFSATLGLQHDVLKLEGDL